MTICPRLGKLFGGCKFSPRYDTVSAVTPDVFAYATGAATVKPTAARKTYIADVCERCGELRNRRVVKP